MYKCNHCKDNGMIFNSLNGSYALCYCQQTTDNEGSATKEVEERKNVAANLIDAVNDGQLSFSDLKEAQGIINTQETSSEIGLEVSSENITPAQEIFPDAKPRRGRPKKRRLTIVE